MSKTPSQQGRLVSSSRPLGKLQRPAPKTQPGHKRQQRVHHHQQTVEQETLEDAAHTAGCEKERGKPVPWCRRGVLCVEVRPRFTQATSWERAWDTRGTNVTHLEMAFSHAIGIFDLRLDSQGSSVVVI